MRRLLAALAGSALVAAITAGVVFALNYEGEDFCQDAKAWPDGTYLGQMHPFHSDFYRGYAERRGWDPCTTWATDQRNSAIRGLRELGYTVIEPGATVSESAPASQEDEAAASAGAAHPIAQHPDFMRIYDESLRRGATPSQALEIAISVINRGTVDAFMAGTDTGVIFGTSAAESATESAPAPPRVSGQGTTTRNVNLTSGLWIADLQVSGNRNCRFGSCRPTNFIVWIESVAGGRELLANEIVEGWSASVTFRVGYGFLDDLSPGNAVVSVDAASDGRWSVTFRRQ